MINSIQQILSNVGGLSTLLTSVRRVDKIYEVFVYCLVIETLRNMNATLEIRDANDKPTADLNFRLSPGYLWTPRAQAGFIYFTYNNHEYELHNGVRIQGRSHVLHEADICILDRSEAENCRYNSIHPKQTKTKMLIECKFYGRGLPLNLGREFLGLKAEFSLRVTTLASNSSSSGVFDLIKAHKGTTNFDISCSNVSNNNVFNHWLQKELEHVL